jgi:hypothetical protein
LPQRLLLGSLSQNLRRVIATIATWHRKFCDAVSQQLRCGIATIAMRYRNNCDAVSQELRCGGCGTTLTVFGGQRANLPQSFTFSGVAAVPEPTSIAFLATGGLAVNAVAAARRRRRTGAGS